MITFADITTYLLSWFLYLQSAFNKLRIYCGLISVKHNVIGYFMYEDLPCSSLSHHPKRLANQRKYDNFRPDDLVLITYAKAGTHFTMGIINSIYALKGLIQKTHSMVPKHMCALELIPAAFAVLRGFRGLEPHGTKDLDDAPSPRVIVSHLPWRLLPQPIKDGKVKTVHCMRNPKDVACSAYPFMRKMNIISNDLSWENFFNLFFSENMFGGSYVSYMKDWYPHRNETNLLNVTYEDMVKDLEGNVRRIAEFIGIELTEEEIQQVASENTFANKKKSSGKYHPIYNKGKSGNWRSKFTLEQNDICDAYLQEHMKDMPDLQLNYE